MKTTLLTALSILFIIFSHSAHAATPTFTGLSQNDVDNINREMGANSSWHSVSTPSSLGSIWGFELGLVAGTTNSPDINTIAQRTDSNITVNNLPHAALLGGVTFPFGISVEALYTPKINTSGINYQQYGGAVKLNITDYLIPIPVINIAVRGFLAKSQISFTDTLTDSTTHQSIQANVAQNSQVTGATLLVSPKLIPVIEPYLGIGYLSMKGSLNADATNTSLFTSTSVSPDTSLVSSQILVGLEAKLLIFALAAEYERSFDKDSITGKFSFKF